MACACTTLHLTGFQSVIFTGDVTSEKFVHAAWCTLPLLGNDLSVGLHRRWGRQGSGAHRSLLVCPCPLLPGWAMLSATCPQISPPINTSKSFCRKEGEPPCCTAIVWPFPGPGLYMLHFAILSSAAKAGVPCYAIDKFIQMSLVCPGSNTTPRAACIKWGDGRSTMWLISAASCVL